MGCASSKNSSRCRHCKTSNSPFPRRSFSMNVHHRPLKEGDSYHVVALTSSTLGSINTPPNQHETKWVDDVEVKMEKKEEFSMGVIEAKAWSKLIDEKISRVVPKTPIMTPPGEPENINVEDLMEGLEQSSPLRLKEHNRSFSFHVTTQSIPSTEIGVQKDGLRSPNRVWFDALDKETGLLNPDLISEAIVSEIDPQLISAFRKALQELSPTHPFHVKALDQNQQQEEANNDDVHEVMERN